MIQFGTSKDNIQDGGLTPSLVNPFIGKARLISVTKEDFETKNKDVYPNTLIFLFKVAGTDEAGNDVTGHQVRHLEFAPREDADQEKVNNLTGRIGYIMKKVLGAEKALIDASSVKSWEHFCDIVVQRFESTPNYNKVPLMLKVIANEYKGNINVQIPKYKGFLKNEDDKVALSFSTAEQKINQKHINNQNLKPDASDDLESTSSGVNLPDVDEDDIF